MNEIPRGPEDLPLMGFCKILKMKVLIYDLKTDKVIREEIIDYGNIEHRKWLGKISYYCATNNYSVETMSYEDWEKYK